MQQEGFELCPSFRCYSINGVAVNAARVSREYSGSESSDHCSVSGEDHFLPFDFFNDDCREEEDFEFVSNWMSGDKEVFIDGEISPAFPIFDRELLTEEDSQRMDGGDSVRGREGVQSIRIPFEKLLIGDRDGEGEPERDRDRESPSSSSSEADELEDVPSGTYCVWRPKAVEAARGRCKKSKSTGSSSSRGWRLIEFLRRSNSDGKNSFVFLTPTSRSNSMNEKEEVKAAKTEDLKETKSSGKAKVVASKSKAKGIHSDKLSSAHEVFYVRNRMLKEEGKRRSYLPYKQDLMIGFWSNIHSLGRTFPPF